MAVEERHSPTTAGDGTAVASEDGDNSSLGLERVLNTNVVEVAREPLGNARPRRRMPSVQR
jgi:hypothetical protein